MTSLDDRVSVHHGSALDLPFGDFTFDGVYSMNVSTNIADRDVLHREIHRALRPGGWLVLSEPAKGPNPVEHEFPVPWARTAADSFLATPEGRCASLEAGDFDRE